MRKVRTFLRQGARIVLLGAVTTCADERSTTAPLAITPQVVPVLAPALLLAENSLTNASTYTTSSISPSPNTLVTVAVMGIRTFGASASPTLTGGGMATWTEVASVVFDSIPFPMRRMTVYRAMSAAPTSGPITISFSGTQSNAQVIVVQWDGVETSGVNGAGAIGQIGSSLGDLVNGLSVSLAPFANSSNVAFGVFGVRSGVHGLPMISPGSGFIELSEQVSQENTPSDLQAEWATSLNTIAATWQNLFGGALAIEIIAATPEPEPVATVTVDPAAPSVNVGATLQLTATPRDANGNPLTGRVVTWGSSNSARATVTATGLVTGVAVGPVMITATSEQQSGAAAVTVTPVPVATVTVAPAAPSVDVGATQQLAVTLQDANGNPLIGRVVTWGSSNSAVATVSPTGMVTGVAGGAVTITAISEGQLGTASLTVTDPNTFSHTLLTFGTNPANLKVYTTASIAPAANALVTVAVLEYSGLGTPPVPTLSGGGMAAWEVVGTVVFDILAAPAQRLTIFRALRPAPGSGPITITSSMTLSHAHWSVSQWTGVETSGVNGAGAVRQIGVARADLVSGLTIPLGPLASPTSVQYGAFGVQIRTPDVTPGAGFTEISEQASGESTPGVLQTEWGANGGTVAATWPTFSAGGLAIEINTSGTVPPGPAPVASVTVAPTPVSVNVGATQQLTATPKDAAGNPLTGRTVTWVSGNIAIATVSSTGLVTGVAGGPVSITATSEGQVGTAAVTVTPVPVATVTLAPTPVSVTVAATQQLTVTLRDAAGNPLTGRTVTWASSNLAVATVNATGMVTGVLAGPVSITATSEGIVGTAAVTVTLVPVATVTVAPATPSVNVGATQQLTATLRDANNNVLTGRVVTWVSGNTAIATVGSTTGLVTGMGAGGPVTITATSEGQNGTAAVSVTLAPVATVTVAPATPSVNVGATQQLTATLRDANNNVLTGRVVTWVSGNTAIATVGSTTGLVTGVAVGGPVTITATSEGIVGTAAVTVTLAPVATVTLAPTPVSVTVAATQQLTVTLQDAAGNPLTGRTVTWASSNLAVATVNATGMVTGVLAGPVSITATSEGIVGTAAVTVTLVPVATVTVAPATPSVNVGATQQLTVELRDANNNLLTGRAVTWVSGNTAIATVSATGMVTGMGAGGPVTITATSEGQNGTAAVSVTLAPVATVTVAPATPSVNVGATQQLTATLRDANNNVLTGRVVTWVSGNTAIATVGSTTGLVTGVAVGGPVTITATSEGIVGTAAVTVTLAPVATVTVAPTPMSVNVGATQQLTATLRDANNNVLTGRVVTWVSGNTAIATVGSTTGLVTGVAGGGPVTITATSEGQNGTAAVTVTAPVASVTVAPTPASVNVGATQQLTVTLRDANNNVLTGRVVTWTSGNTAVATVSATGGLVTGMGAGGPVTITATSEGQAGTAEVTVTLSSVATVDITPATAVIPWGSTRQFLATPKDAAGTPLTGRAVTWASSPSTIATVTATGLVRGVSPGSATITATSEGTVGTASVTVSQAALLIGAGDISESNNNNDELTAQLLDASPGTVFTVGDNVYESGTTFEFNNYYNPTWGRHKARTIPVAGNHDYNTSNATGYYNYFGAAAGDPTKGYYSFDQGDWHVVVLNSNISRSASSAQVQWLRADLAASAKQCQVAIWHHPLWTNMISRNTNTSIRAFWDALWSAGVELVINGHDHHYLRFAPQTAKGGLDPTGIRQITVGTGGASPLYEFGPMGSNVEVRNNATFGVLELTLRANDYDWRFVPIAGQTFTDAGTGSCVGPRPAPSNQLPIARPGGPYQADAAVAFDGRASSDPDNDTPLSYAWNFGDGTTGTNAQPTHTYGADGVYTVSLVVTDALGGQSAPVTTTATIANVAPTVNAGPDVARGVGSPFNLQAGISDPGLNDGPWTYVINWGDGTTQSSGSTATQGASISAVHTYAAAGDYVATVTVTDKDGGTGSDAVTVHVTQVAPGAITHTLLTAGNNVGNQQSYSTDAFAPGSDALITVAVLQRSTVGTPPIPTLSGGGMATWDVVKTVTFDGATASRRLTIFRAMNPQPGNGPLTITSALTLSNMQWIVSQWDGVDVSGVNGAGAVVQSGSATSPTGTPVNGLTVALAGFGHPNNVAYGVFGVAKSTIAVTPGTGFTEISEQPSGESQASDLQAEWATNQSSIVASWASLTAGALGIEIKVRP